MTTDSKTKPKATEERLEEIRDSARRVAPPPPADIAVKTATGAIDPAQTGYYGLPLLKPPTWTWEVPLVLFSGRDFGDFGVHRVCGANFWGADQFDSHGVVDGIDWGVDLSGVVDFGSWAAAAISEYVAGVQVAIADVDGVVDSGGIFGMRICGGRGD